MWFQEENMGIQYINIKLGNNGSIIEVSSIKCLFLIIDGELSCVNYTAIINYVNYKLYKTFLKKCNYCKTKYWKYY